jgi:hypothetical protein
VNFTDDAFFRFYSFRFVAGKPFTEENVKHGDKCIVITDVLAKKMWGNESEAVGKSLLLNYLPYRVVGVVKEVSPLLRKSSADVYSPYSVKDSNMHYIDSENRYEGGLVVSVLLKKGFTRQMMLDELEPHKARILSELKSTTGIDYQWEFIAKPHWAESMIMFFGSASDYSTSKLLLNLLLGWSVIVFGLCDIIFIVTAACRAEQEHLGILALFSLFLKLLITLNICNRTGNLVRILGNHLISGTVINYSATLRHI